MVSARERHRAPAAREALRARRQEPHRRDRVQVHPPRRGNVRLRVHVPPVRGDLLRARVREDRRAAHVRARQAGAPGVADDADRLPAGDRARAQGPADRAARAGGHGVLLPAPDATSGSSRRTSSSSERTSAARRTSSATPRSGWGGSSRSSSRPARLRPSYPRKRTSSPAPSTPPQPRCSRP